MGLLGWLLWGRGRGVDQLAQRLDVEPRELRRMRPQYRRFTIPKRSGGAREILAPDPELKKLQRRILRRLLARLRVHDAVHGFQRGRSIVTNALVHQGQEIVVGLDVRDFFPSTSAHRIRKYFRKVGWNRPAAKLLTRLCTHNGGLPQGAPTSPRLSNLVNYRLDARIAGMAKSMDGAYTRYADDITISFSQRNDEDWLVRSGAAERTPPNRVSYIQGFVRRVLQDEGYRLHGRRKRSIRRAHHRQLVTGLVVNQRVNLPRETRRWLRAVEHRARLAKSSPLDYHKAADYSRRKRPTLNAEELRGWQAYLAMVKRQADAPPPPS